MEWGEIEESREQSCMCGSVDLRGHDGVLYQLYSPPGSPCLEIEYRFRSSRPVESKFP